MSWGALFFVEEVTLPLVGIIGSPGVLAGAALFLLGVGVYAGIQWSKKTYCYDEQRGEINALHRQLLEAQKAGAQLNSELFTLRNQFLAVQVRNQERTPHLARPY